MSARLLAGVVAVRIPSWANQVVRLVLIVDRHQHKRKYGHHRQESLKHDAAAVRLLKSALTPLSIAHAERAAFGSDTKLYNSSNAINCYDGRGELTQVKVGDKR